jgi:hypothetical protein
VCEFLQHVLTSVFLKQAQNMSYPLLLESYPKCYHLKIGENAMQL